MITCCWGRRLENKFYILQLTHRWSVVERNVRADTLGYSKIHTHPVSWPKTCLFMWLIIFGYTNLVLTDRTNVYIVNPGKTEYYGLCNKYLAEIYIYLYTQNNNNNNK